jgi:transcriptional regulator with XRE-family HTH domain
MNHDNAMNLGARIRLERQKRSWTQEQLAERARLNPRTVQRAESGAEVSPETLRLVAEAFGIAPEALRPATPRVRFAPSFKRYAPYLGTVHLLAWLGVVMFAVLTDHHRPGLPGLLGVAVLFIVSTLVANITGYSLSGGRLHVHHGGWATRYDLSRLTGVTVNHDAMVGAWTYIGLITCYGFIARYRSVTLGRFTGYISNDRDCVVMDFGPKRVVATIADPEAFAEALREAARGTCAKAPAQDAVAAGADNG